MQYWRPAGAFAGDMMPYWDGGRFHLFYLLDHDHHAEQGGLGGHQWAHASTTDLVAWQHHPLALPLGEPGSVDQHGICTGSIFAWDGVYHAFYATRIRHADGSVFEAVCRASSRDLIRFDKSPDNPLFAAGQGLDPAHHRDPFVFHDPGTGLFHMLVTAREADAPGRPGRGILAQYASPDLERWTPQPPFLTLDDGHPPECPELFCWNGLWYLVHSHRAQMQYRVADDPLGPWRHARRTDIEPGPNLSVPRTAAFTGGRRLAAGFLPWRQDSRDEGWPVYAGNAVFRELIQEDDGTLAARFVPEMTPATGAPIPVRGHDGSFTGNVEADAGIALVEAPADGVISLRLTPSADAREYGLLLRTDERGESGYRLRFRPREGSVVLERRHGGDGPPAAVLDDVEGLDGTVSVVICVQDSVVDVCLNDRRTLVERAFNDRGVWLGLWTTGGTLHVNDLRLAPLRPAPLGPQTQEHETP